jgi:G3E family GTPase
VFELMLEQAECADVLVLNKCDLVTPAELDELEAMLRGLNERADVIRSEQGRVDQATLLGRVRFNAQETLRAATWLKTLNRLAPTSGSASGENAFTVNPRKTPAAPTMPEHERKFGIRSVIYQARRPFAEEKLRAFLLNEAAGLLRAKGFFWTRERPDEMGFLSVAGGVARCDYLNYWWASLVESGKVSLAERPDAIRAIWEEPHGDRRQELVFIGVGLDAEKITTALNACVV